MTRFIKAASVVALFGATLGAWTPLEAVAKPKSPPVVTITARDYAYDTIPDIPAGVVDLRLHNLGSDIHHAAIFKLAAGKTAADFVAAIKNPGPPPAWALPVPGPNAPAPGSTSNVISEYMPGSYVVLCFVDTKGGVPHFMKGMSRAFRVVPSRNKAKIPKADAAVELFDYGFKFGRVSAGAHVFRVLNSATQLHEVELFQLAPGMTEKDLHGWLTGPMTSRPPGMPIGGVMNVLPGARPEFRATLAPGRYVAFCFIPDAKDGKAHFFHGMEYAFDVR